MDKPPESPRPVLPSVKDDPYRMLDRIAAAYHKHRMAMWAYDQARGERSINRVFLRPRRKVDEEQREEARLKAPKLTKEMTRTRKYMEQTVQELHLVLRSLTDPVPNEAYEGLADAEPHYVDAE
jgi:hypothetical protein